MQLRQKKTYLIVLLENLIKMCYCSGKTTCEGLKIDGITSHICQERLIHESTHIPDDSFSFINSIFTSQPNLATESS